MNRVQSMSLHRRSGSEASLKSPVASRRAGQVSCQAVAGPCRQLMPVQGHQQELLEAIKKSQQANKWVVLVAAPDRRVTRWLIDNGVSAARLLQVHPKNQQALMRAVTQGLMSETCSLVVGWTDLLSEDQWLALTAEAACYQTNSLLFHRPQQACQQATPWPSARRSTAMVASVLVH